jgi:DNA-binding transcriptional LysR family regulator
VAEERHFGRAAERLRIAQPGLSQQIKALEKNIGTRLFDRGVRPVALTPAGEALLPRARKVIEAAGHAMEAARTSSSNGRSVLKLGSLLVGHFPQVSQLLDLFRARFPDVEVRVSPGLSLQNFDLLSRGELDAAVVHAPSDWPRTPRYLRLGTHEMIIMLPAGHSLASLERIPRVRLLEERFLDWPRSLNPRLLDHVHREVFGVPQHPNRIEVADAVDAGSRALLVAQGMGIAVDALHVPSGDLPTKPAVVYRRIEDPPPLIEHGLIWFEEELSPVASSLVDVAREHVEASNVLSRDQVKTVRR